MVTKHCQYLLFSQVTFSEDVGELYKIRLGFQENSRDRGWLIKKVRHKCSISHCILSWYSCGLIFKLYDIEEIHMKIQILIFISQL